MHDAETYADLMNQRQLFSERSQVPGIFCDLAGQFDDEGFALKPLNVGQSLAQQIESELIVDI
jgi:hypothetical protein